MNSDTQAAHADTVFFNGKIATQDDKRSFADSLAVADGLIVAAGHGPEGLTAGPWSGLAVAQLAVGQPTVTDLTPFDPSRFGPGQTCA